MQASEEECCVTRKSVNRTGLTLPSCRNKIALTKDIAVLLLARSDILNRFHGLNPSWYDSSAYNRYTHAASHLHGGRVKLCRFYVRS